MSSSRLYVLEKRVNEYEWSRCIHLLPTSSEANIEYLFERESVLHPQFDYRIAVYNHSCYVEPHKEIEGGGE